MSSRNRRESYMPSSRQCPLHKEIPLSFIREKLECTVCKETEACNVCNLKICKRCMDKYSEIQKEKFKSETQQSEAKYFILLQGLVGLILILLGVLCWKLLDSEKSAQGLTPIDNLRSYFPSQTNDTWKNIISILDLKFPTVKSLILLQGKNDKTAECLVSKLIMEYTNTNNIKIEDISFKNVSEEVTDYGEVLEYYRPIVEKHKIFVTDLNKISANLARIFHSFCDEGASPIKPSLFIFILRYGENVKENVKPSKRARSILQESWQDLPSNELHPLLSRVVKNVIDVIPEKHVKC